MIRRAPVIRIDLPAPAWRVRWRDGGTAVVGTDLGPRMDSPAGQVLAVDLSTERPLWTPTPGPWRVLDLALSADRTYVAVAESAERDNTMSTRTRVLEVETGKQVWPRQGDEQEQTYTYSKRFFPRAVAFTPDGRALLSAGPVVTEDGVPEARVWRLDIGSFRRTDLLTEDRDPRDLAVSPDGAFVAVACGDSLVVTDTYGDSLIERADEYGLSSVAFSPDSAFVAAGGTDGRVFLIKVAERQDGPPIKLDLPVTSVAFSPDGTRVAAVLERGVAVFRTVDGHRLFLADVPEASTAVFSPDLRFLAVNQTMVDPSIAGVVVLDADTGSAVWQDETSDRVVDLAFSVDGSQLLAGGANSTLTGFLHVYDTGSVRARRLLGGAVTSVVTSVRLNDSQLVALASSDSRVVVIDAAEPGQTRLNRPHDSLVTAVAIGPENQEIVTGCADGEVRVFSGFSAVPEWSIQTGGSVTELMCAGEWVAAGGRDRKVRLLSLSTGDELWHYDLQGAVTALAFSPDGTWLGVGGADRHTRVLDTATGTMRCDITQDGKVVALAVAPDGAALATGNEDGTVFVVDPANGAVLRRVGHSDAVTAVAVSPDSRTLVSGGNDGTVRFTALATQTEPMTVDYHAPVTVLAVSRDGLVAVVTEKALVEVFDLVTAARLTRLTHPARVQAAAFTADGTLLVTGCDDSVVRVFEAR